MCLIRPSGTGELKPMLIIEVKLYLNSMRYLVLLFCFFLGSCVPSYLTTRPELVYTWNRGNQPFLNDSAEAEVGDLIYTEFNYRVNPAVELTEDLDSKYGKVSSNMKLSKVEKDDIEAYVSISLTGRSITYLADRNQNGKFDHIMVQARENRTNWKRLKSEVPYRKVHGIKAESGGFELKLVFEGLEGNFLKVSYWEYIEDLTRAASIRDESFMLQSSRPDTIVIEGSKIEILDVNPSMLTYRVLEGFSHEMDEN